MTETVRELVGDKHGAIYFFPNGDVAVTWKGPQKATLESLCRLLYDRYAPKAQKKMHAYYDMQAQAEELRLACKKYAATPETKAEVDVAKNGEPLPLCFSESQKAAFYVAVRKRGSRQKLTTVVVDDDAFSRKLLYGMLAQTYDAFAAADGQSALELYASKAPDLVFLDIMLSDANGHDLAARIRGLDPKAHIVMVSGNAFAEEVLRAKENGAKGFVAKPYNRQKIDSVIDVFIKERMH